MKYADTSAIFKAPTQPEPYYIRIIDHCTGDPIPGARVYWNGQERITDADGRIDIGDMLPGTYDVPYIHADGYISSDSAANNLNNKSFTIPDA